MLTYELSEGMHFIIYSYSNEEKYEVEVDEASGVNPGDFYNYFEFDMDANMFVVKQDFEGTFYIKFNEGKIYVSIVNP